MICIAEMLCAGMGRLLGVGFEANRSGIAGQAVMSSRVERFRLGERLERLSISMPTTWLASL